MIGVYRYQALANRKSTRRKVTYLSPRDCTPDQTSKEQHVLLADRHRKALGEAQLAPEANAVHRQCPA